MIFKCHNKRRDLQTECWGFVLILEYADRPPDRCAQMHSIREEIFFLFLKCLEKSDWKENAQKIYLMSETRSSLLMEVMV